jgi:GDP-L-fucose synthase
MEKSSLIYVAGHRGMLGSQVIKQLKELGYENLITRTRDELDLLDQKSVEDFFQENKPDYVINCAARVGGIKDNMNHPADFLYENLQIQNNIIWSSKNADVKKLLFIASSTIYPTDCPQPISEDSLLSGKIEKQNEGYAISKISGIKLCEYIFDQYDKNFISCVPTNIYGEGSSFDPETSHVIPSLIRRMHEAMIQNTPEVVIWGDGEARREFLYVNDFSKAIVWMMDNYNEKPFLNIGTGEDISIKELAFKIKDIVGYQGSLVFDSTKPSGTPRRQLDVSKINDLGWHHTTRIDEGVKKTYEWYLTNIAK